MVEKENFNVRESESIDRQILDSYLRVIEKSFDESCPQLKLINYGTGSGKTYQFFQAIYKTINKYPDKQIIGIYVAPLREHLSVPSSLEKDYSDIPVYKLNSLEMIMTDEKIELYKEWIPLILEDRELWQKARDLSDEEKVEENKQRLKTAKGVINRLKFFQTVGLGDEKYNKSEITKAKGEINNSLEGFLEFFIKCDLDKENCLDECLELIKIFFPLYLLREKSGILMLTYKKFETKIPYFQHNGKKWVKKSKYLDRYVIENKNNSSKFIFAFDEQEDGYQIMLKEKIDIISPEEMAINNALSSISREFSILFSQQSDRNITLLNFLDSNKGAFRELQEHCEKGKILDLQLEEYAAIYNKLVFEEGNSDLFLEKAISIKKGLEKSSKDIIEMFEFFDCENPIKLDFEMLSRVLAKFENNRGLLIPQNLYRDISDELMNIFSYNNLYIYNIEPLQEIFINKSSSGHVRITDKKVADKTSIAELIYTIISIRSQIKNIKKILENVLDAEDSQSHSLNIWFKQIDKVDKANKEEKNLTENEKTEYLDRYYVYKSNKSIINLKEISRYKGLIERGLTEVSVGSTAIFTSPEYRMTSILEKKDNIVFLISATGGITGDLSTSYDMVYLEDELLNESGESYFNEMSDSEIEVCKSLRDYRQTKRKITVDFFSEDVSSFPNDRTKEVVERFEELVLNDFINNPENQLLKRNRYKVQELSKFIHFLFYLFEDDSIQETIAFTQSLYWIKKLIDFCSIQNHDNFIFKESSEHPNIYYVEVKHKQYRSNIKVKLICYYASFNKDYYDRTIKKTYLDELVEEEGQKIFFISAYQSASKGLNPIIKTKNGKEKDFDSLVLLMDSFYSLMKSPSKKSKDKNDPDKDSEKYTTLSHFALMKSIVTISDSNIKIKDFNKYLNTPEASTFKQEQHQILLGKGTLQAIGRSERRNFPEQVIKIFINEETRKNLVIFYNYLEREEENEIKKLSVNNYAVYQKVKEEEKKRSIKNYDDHRDNEIDAEKTFDNFRNKMLEEIELFHQKQNTFNITKAWEALRDPIVFKDPAKYLEKLKETKLFPDDFISSLFYYNNEQPEFIPYLASVDGQPFKIISDSIHGEQIYNYQQRLYPEYLKTNSSGYDLEGNEIGLPDPSSDSIYKLYNELIPEPEIFDRYIPRWSFFKDLLHPSLTENFVERWIKDIIFDGKDWKAIKKFYGFEKLSDFQKYNKLYELFDLFYFKDNTLFCIDVKEWSKASGNRLSKEVVPKTKDKLNKICSDYPEFKNVKGLLLNLHTNKEKNKPHSSTLYSGNLIYFNDSHYPLISSKLKDFLFSK